MQMLWDKGAVSDLSDEHYLSLSRDMLADGRADAARAILIAADRHTALWESDDGVALLADVVATLIDMLAVRRVADAIAAATVFPRRLAAQAIDLLLLAFFPDDGEANLATLDDAAFLCVALLLGARGDAADVPGFIDEALAQRTDPDFDFAALVIRDHFARSAPEERFKAKLVIWDLDDTLWQGTLADGDVPVLNEERAGFVRALNRHGIVSAICSKNDHAAARAQLEAFGLWDDFVFPRIAFLPKGEVIRQLIADMQLRPANVLFVDDNLRNLAEAEAAAHGIRVVDATSDDCDAMLRQILDENRHVGKSRVSEYRILEARVAEREQSALTDEDFLLQSDIRATFTHRMDNLDFAERIEELINRSNQLNYTGTRVAAGSMRELIMNVSDYDIFCAFVWDRYGYYGLVGVAIFDKLRQQLTHFAFSCRIMHMGVEDYLLQALSERYASVGLDHLRKPLPPQSSSAIAALPFEDPDVRARILAEEAPRDWSKIRLRLMCDCQSGAFHHYSRFREAIDFDNIPRVFTLPMMLSGAYRDQHFPEYLVYTPATDYMDWRWEELMPVIDPALYTQAAERFADMIAAGGHQLLLFLPPEDAPEARYAVVPTASAAEMQARNRTFNALWRTIAARDPERIACIELGAMAGEADMMGHAYHYVPSVLLRMSSLIDDWYEGPRKAIAQAV